MSPLKRAFASVAAAFIVAVQPASAQQYPTKAIRLVVHYAAGGTTDIVARLVAQRMAERLGQPIVVENRPGGDALIGTEAVARALPDSYTVLVSAPSAIAILPHMRKRLPYDPFRDFVHVGHMAYAQFALAVHPSVRAANVAELVALAKSRPGKLTYATGSATGNITGEMFKLATGTDIVNVPYKGVAPATADVLSGQVAMMFITFGGAISYIKAGKLHALAVTGSKRSPALPEAPTMGEAGVKDFESSAFWGLSVPKGTPAAVVRILGNEVTAVVRMPDVVEKILSVGMEPRTGTPEEYTAFLRAEFEKYRLILPRIGIRPE